MDEQSIGGVQLDANVVNGPSTVHVIHPMSLLAICEDLDEWEDGLRTV